MVCGADDPKAGACGSVMNVVDHPALNHRVPTERGLMAERCGEVLKEFFAKRRPAFLGGQASPTATPR